MVQVIPLSQQQQLNMQKQAAQPSFGQLIAQGMQQMQAKKQQQSGNEQLKQITGMDISSLPPEMQKAVVVEALKSQGKNTQLGQKLSFLDQTFGGNQQKNMGQQLAGQNPMEQQGQQEDQGFDPTQLSDAQIAQATAIDPNIGRSLQHAKDVGLREKREEQKLQFSREKIDRKEAHEVVKPLLQELNSSRKNIPLQEQAIEDIQNAAPNVGALDYIADVTGFEPLRSAKGAQLKTAIKDFFLSDLTRAGSRPNQWIEQQLSEALPKLGRSTAANLTVAEGMKFKVDLAKQRVQILDDLIAKDKEKYGYVKDDIDSRASQLMRPYVEQRKKDLVDNIKKIQTDSKGSKKATPKGYTRMQNPQTGEVFEILNGHVSDAEESGWLAQ